MGHAVSKETISQFKGLTLDGVVPVNDELGRGAYGEVFTVRYVRMFTEGHCNHRNIIYKLAVYASL